MGWSRLDRFAEPSEGIGDGLKWGERGSEGANTIPATFLTWTAAEFIVLVSVRKAVQEEKAGWGMLSWSC